MYKRQVYSIQETQGGFDGYNTDPDTEQLLIPSVDVDAYLAKLVEMCIRDRASTCASGNSMSL